MIYSIIILILSLLLFPVHSFYIINAGVIEQCSTGKNLYLKQFDSKKMGCLNKKWRQVFISLEYTCVINSLRRRWKIQTNVNQGSTWPKQISVLTNKGENIYYSSRSIRIVLILPQTIRRIL
jgi:hypothetical protein